MSALILSECRSKNEIPSMYPQAKGILHAFKDKGVNVAIASRSPTPDIANAFLQKLGIKSMFVAQVRWWKSQHLFLLLFWCYDNLQFFSAVHLALCLLVSSWLPCDHSFHGWGVGEYAGVEKYKENNRSITMLSICYGMKSLMSYTNECCFTEFLMTKP